VGSERVEKKIEASAAKRLKAQSILSRRDGAALSTLLEKEFSSTIKVLGDEGASDRDKRAFIIDSLSEFIDSHQSSREAEEAAELAKTLEVIDMLSILKGPSD